MSANRAGAQDADTSPSQCWCCGTTEEPTRLVHLGNHPEVGLCVRCAHSVSKWAWEIEDQAKTGPLAMAVTGSARCVVPSSDAACTRAHSSADRSDGSANASRNRYPHIGFLFTCPMTGAWQGLV